MNSATTASVTVTGLTTNTQYRWQVKAKDNTGAYSAAYATFNSGSLSYGVDLNDPTAPATVYDGSSAGTDTAYNTGSLSTLSANWTAAAADTGGSGFSKYQYAIGTTAGATDVRTWTDNATTSVTVSTLTLRTSQMYYFTIVTVDASGRTSSVASSNGQWVAPTLTFSVNASTVALSNLNATNSYTDTKTSTLTTSTNAYGGYVIRAYGSPLTTGSNTVAAFNGGTHASPDAWTGADIGFGYTSSDTLVQGSNKFQSTTCPGGNAKTDAGCYAPFTASSPGDIVADHASGITGTAVTGEAFTITYKATVNATQAAGRYANTVVFSATATY